MKKIGKLLTFILALFSGLFVSAQSAENTKSLLWQITGNGLEKPSYIFGTMHIICPSDYIWTDIMKRSLDKSEKLCLELDMDDMGAIMRAMGGLIDSSGKKLSDYFTSDQYAELTKYVKDNIGMDISLLSNMKPVALQTMMSKKEASLCENPMSYEENIMDEAKKSKKEVMGLETPEEQLTALQSIPVDSVIKGIIDAIHDTDESTEGKEQFAQMVAAYKQQDINALHKMIADGDGLGDATDALLDDRNKRWIGRMGKMMNTSSVFFAVGAGHLAGNTGVINLLKQKGYKVIPMK